LASFSIRFPARAKKRWNWRGLPAQPDGGQLHRELAELAEFPFRSIPLATLSKSAQATMPWLNCCSLAAALPQASG
jgi:hypothetical protein